MVDPNPADVERVGAVTPEGITPHELKSSAGLRAEVERRRANELESHLRSQLESDKAKLQTEVEQLRGLLPKLYRLEAQVKVGRAASVGVYVSNIAGASALALAAFAPTGWVQVIVLSSGLTLYVTSVLMTWIPAAVDRTMNEE